MVKHMKACSVPGCDKVSIYPICSMHKWRWKMHGSYELPVKPSPIERFWASADRTGGPDSCWMWLKSTDEKGYGFYGWKGRLRRANRVCWEITHGPIPTGMEVCHSCDVRGCVNPAHLWLGTHNDNMNDMANKGRARPVRGEKSHRAKITGFDVIEIRRLCSDKVKHAIIADRFGISTGAVSQIFTRRCWKHIP